MTANGNAAVDAWYYESHGAQAGPISQEEAGNKILAGEISGQTLVWKDGMADWQKAAETGLKAFFTANHTPPPQAAGPAAGPPPAGAPQLANIYAASGKIKGKVRKPLNVILLSIFTLGIYNFVWYYCTFEELRNYRGQGWSGVTFLLLLLLLGIPMIVVPWLLPAYVGRLYLEDGRTPPINGWTGCWIFLPLAGGIVWTVKVQRRLNEFWQSV